MPINIIPNTEDFSSGVWTPSGGLVVTVDTAAAPAFAGPSAGLADTIEDTAAGSVSLNLLTYQSIPADSTAWILSCFVKKDAVTSRFPAFLLQMNGGSGPFAGVNLNTSSGAVANYFNNFPALDDKGVVDVDASWWRVWCKLSNDGTNNQIRVFLQPCQCSTIGDVDDATLTGSIIAWGINLTNTATLQTYEPDPFYVFSTANPFFGCITAQTLRR